MVLGEELWELENLDLGYKIGMVKTRRTFPALIYGNQNHPTTYDFPIRIKLWDWEAPEEQKEEWAGWNLEDFIRCAKELEMEGVSAIVGSCGLTGTLQPDVVNDVNVPVCTSSLLLVPLVSRIIGKDKKVGILTASADSCYAQNCRLLRSVGIDESIPIEIVGMDQPEYRDIFRTQFLRDRSKYDPEKVEAIMVAAAKELVSKGNIGAIVLECTEMPLYAAAVQEATGLPVFDGVGLNNLIFSSVSKNRYF
jgi:Asp/Glu/hydantoin racemase